MPQTVAQVLSQGHFIAHADEFLLLKLPPTAIVAAAAVIAELAAPFCALILDSRELTLILDRESCDEYRHRLPGAQIAEESYRLLTLDVALEPLLTGLMAAITAALAEAGVSILPLAAFEHDHLLVPASQCDAALQALRALQARQRETP